ncbi:uncharacterized protein A1O9_01264 [Exophiala aquamarina CBS 119918]|uniref:GST C-terminal domain-containing protein n=1 Tax=Exophiala aquamarina CBS 119918 TaxID=1182545 RepID=A0A072PUA0_9EURO|nr:uncharacterized protein A1O9_01264 [Exophiala aquamarina CBS 119918]KEF63287.1 hypothetical protein A1O9_01264 [Exophiala aquamarina CBS 119918]
MAARRAVSAVHARRIASCDEWPRASGIQRQDPHCLGKSPVIKDGDVVVQEIPTNESRYLCETCDGEARLLPRETKARAKVREFMAAAEATFMLHALAILYARWRLPERAADCLPEMEKGLSSNVHNDFAWLEHELAASSDNFLVGGHLTAADIIMGFSIEFIFARKLGTERDGRWPRIQHWLDRIRDEPSYKKAVERTGYKL